MSALDMTPEPSTDAPLCRLLDQFSLEVTSSDLAGIAVLADRIPRGTQVSITFLPNETFDQGVKMARALRDAGFDPMPHLSARRIPSRSALADYLDRLVETAAVDRVFVIAGDTDASIGPYDDALAMIRSEEFARRSIRTVAVSGYPEGHPRIDGPTLIRAMHDKCQDIAGQGMSPEIVTQFGFSAAPILDWLAQLRAGGIDHLVRIGLPGPASARTLLRYAAICGVEASSRVLSKYGFSLTRLVRPSGPDRIVDELAASLHLSTHGRAAVHLFPFGGLAQTADWVANASSGCDNVRVTR